MSGALRQVSVAAATLLTIFINSLANALPLNGQTTGAISDRFPVYFVPAGYVFSIWGLIYIGMVAFTAFQALPSQRTSPLLQRVGLLYVVSCLANVSWIFLWHYEQFVLTLVAMFALLATLIAIYRSLQSSREFVGPAGTWALRVPFSIYLGWITVATIANVTVVLHYLGWDGWGIAPQAWAAIMLVTGAAIASAVSLPRADLAYMLVILWAFAGIAVKQAAAPMVAWTAIVAAAVLGLLIAVRLLSGARPGRLPAGNG